MAEELTLHRMTKEEAELLWAKVLENTKTYRSDTSFMLLRLDQERGWEVLGFKSWRECANTLSAQLGVEERSLYRFRDWAEVNDNLSRGTGKTVRLPETHALALKDLEPEQQVMAFTEATSGKPEDARPAAAVFEKAARKVSPSAPKKKRKAARDDSDGWSKDDLKNDSELAMAFASLAILGNEDIKAIQNGTIGLKRADVIFWAKLPRQKALEIQDLVMGNRWSPAEAIKFVGTMPDDNTSVEDLKNYCLSTKGKFYTATIDGFTITVKANRAALRR